MELKCPTCHNERIKPSRKQGLERISPYQPYRCPQCKKRFFLFKIPLASPLFWLVTAGLVVLVLFSVQVIDNMNNQPPLGTRAVTPNLPLAQDETHPPPPSPDLAPGLAPLETAGPEDSSPLPSQLPTTAGTAFPLLRTKGPEQPERAPAQPPGPQQLLDIRVQPAGATRGATTITIQASSPISQYDFFSLSAPPRLILDFKGHWLTPPRRHYGADSPFTKAIRVAKHPDKLRIVLDLATTNLAHPEFTVEENSLRMVLTERR